MSSLHHLNPTQPQDNCLSILSAPISAAPPVTSSTSSHILSMLLRKRAEEILLLYTTLHPERALSPFLWIQEMGRAQHSRAMEHLHLSLRISHWHDRKMTLDFSLWLLSCSGLPPAPVKASLSFTSTTNSPRLNAQRVGSWLVKGQSVGLFEPSTTPLWVNFRWTVPEKTGCCLSHQSEGVRTGSSVLFLFCECAEDDLLCCFTILSMVCRGYVFL